MVYFNDQRPWSLNKSIYNGKVRANLARSIAFHVFHKACYTVRVFGIDKTPSHFVSDGRSTDFTLIRSSDADGAVGGSYLFPGNTEAGRPARWFYQGSFRDFLGFTHDDEMKRHPINGGGCHWLSRGSKKVLLSIFSAAALKP